MTLAVVPFYAVLLGLLYLGLSIRAMSARRTARKAIGPLGTEALDRRLRAHANFAEYVPLVLILLAFAELRGVPVLLLPSDAEGLPLSVLEAMSLGMIVVASAVGAVPECVDHGRDGFLHAPRDPAALADILFMLYAAPPGAWAPVSRAARSKWEERFSRERMIAELGRVYRERLGLEAY